jgi:hypothetical protein
MSGARLRRTFKYPTDSDNDSSPEVIDEQEQDQLISSLQESDSSSTLIYKRVFLIVPLLSILLYIIFAPGLILSILCISSLLATAYALEKLPLPESHLTWRDLLHIPHEAYDGPVQRFFIPLNGALAGIIAFGGYIGRGRGNTQQLVLSILPMCK